MTALTTLPKQELVAGSHWKTSVRVSWRRIIYPLGPLAFSVPFILIALISSRHGFASAEHSHAILDALLAKRTGALEHLGQNASPLVASFAYLLPWLVALRMLAAVAAGMATWVVWRQLVEVPLPAPIRGLLLASFATTPALLFLSNAEASEMITLLLLLVAWRLYLRFVTRGETWSGFAAGLVLALAFFSDFTSIAYVIPFAIAAPATLFRFVEVSPEDRFRAAVTGFLVIALPTIFALLAWCYVTWIVSGNPFAFSGQTPQDAQSLQLLNPDTGPPIFTGPHIFTGTQHALSAMAGDMLRVPLYPLIAMLLLTRSRRTLIAYIFPLLLTTVMRLAGVAHSEAFTLGTYLGFALVGTIAVIARWPQRMRKTRSDRFSRSSVLVFLVVAACAQLTANITYSLRSSEPLVWQHAILDGQSQPVEETSDRLGKELSHLPSHSVLADDNAYKIIARHHTVKPYVLPTDARFELARSAPSDWVDHILVNTSPSAYDHLSQEFSGDVPNFYTDVEWPGWRLLTRVGAAPLETK